MLEVMVNKAGQLPQRRLSVLLVWMSPYQLI